MVIVGKWLLCSDGVTRPTVPAAIQMSDGNLYSEDFLIDSGADRSVFSAAVLQNLNLPANPATPGVALVGISGGTTFVLVTTMVEFTRDDGGPARVRGEFAAFVDPAATDFSILGRDVLDNFDVILSRRRDEILLLAPNHQYQVTRP
jgi:hypothetical protein